MSAFFEVDLFKGGTVSMKVIHTETQKDLHLAARNEVLDRAFHIMVRGGKLTDNPVIRAQIFRKGRKPTEKVWVFDRSRISKELEAEVKAAQATGEYDEYLNTSVEEAWGTLDENPDLKMILETMIL